tara:strand:- start:2653 stop:2856 length:204 start_codon:yes stop_codon:yes gene_type:complete
MKKINKLLLGVFIGMGLSILMVVMMAASPATSTVGNLQYITSRDGIKVYQYNGRIIVRTNNSISISN